MVKVRQDLSGMRVNHLVVLRQVEDKVGSNGRHRPAWLCKCDCGQEIIVVQDTLKGGRIKSCGCQRYQSLIERNLKQKEENDKAIIGKTFGQLQVIERDQSRPSNVHYKCKCLNCGTEISVLKADLISGKIKDCGCLDERKLRYEDLTGQKFGKLTALYYVGRKDKANKRAYWMCQCECGNQKEISADSLKRGYTLSCGCLKQSHGEYKIEQLLIQNNIPYQKECAVFQYENGKYGRFDFYVNQKYFIEFDGEQHIKSNNRWWNTPELVEQYQKRDAEKNKWCKENNIPLIRIPYAHLNDICLNDLLVETTQYLVN